MPRTKQTPALSATPQKDSQFDFLKIKASRVFFLLDLSPQPPEMKTAWVAMLPHMNLAQVDRLIELLEEEIELTLKHAAQHPEQEEFVLKLKSATERYNTAISAADKKTLGVLQSVEARIISGFPLARE